VQNEPNFPRLLPCGNEPGCDRTTTEPQLPPPTATSRREGGRSMTARFSLTACLAFALSATAPATALAADLDLTRAAVVTPVGLSKPEAKAVQMLVEEVESRSMVRWDRAEEWPALGTPVIVVGPGDDVRKLLDTHGIKLPAPAQPKPEGYQ